MNSLKKKDLLTQNSLSLYVATKNIINFKESKRNDSLIEISLNSYEASESLIHFNQSVYSDSLCKWTYLLIQNSLNSYVAMENITHFNESICSLSVHEPVLTEKRDFQTFVWSVSTSGPSALTSCSF